MPLLYFFRSSIGLKMLMAVTGLILLGFVVTHMLGNLQIFLGADQINAYGNFLHSQPELLWGARLVLIAAVIIHIWSGLGLWWLNKAARPIGYATDTAVGATWASRTMAASGIVVLFFIIFHILHFTLGTITPQTFQYRDAQGHHDVYRMVVEGFANPWIAWFYVVSVGLLCIHLSHGFSSTFRSLGWVNKAYRPLQIACSYGLAAFLFIGFTSIPLAVQLGFVKVALQP